MNDDGQLCWTVLLEPHQHIAVYISSEGCLKVALDLCSFRPSLGTSKCQVLGAAKLILESLLEVLGYLQAPRCCGNIGVGVVTVDPPANNARRSVFDETVHFLLSCYGEKVVEFWALAESNKCGNSLQYVSDF